MNNTNITRDVTVSSSDATCEHLITGDKGYLHGGTYYCAACVKPRAAKSTLAMEGRKLELDPNGYRIMNVKGIGAYTYGLARVNKPDVVLLSSAFRSVDVMVNSIIKYLDTIPSPVFPMIITGDKCGYADKVRFKVIELVGDNLQKHFVFNNKLCPNQCWLQIQTPDRKMRVPGEAGFDSTPVNPDTVFTDKLDIFYIS